MNRYLKDYIKMGVIGTTIVGGVSVLSNFAVSSNELVSAVQDPPPLHRHVASRYSRQRQRFSEARLTPTPLLTPVKPIHP